MIKSKGELLIQSQCQQQSLKQQPRVSPEALQDSVCDSLGLRTLANQSSCRFKLSILGLCDRLR